MNSLLPYDLIDTPEAILHTRLRPIFLHRMRQQVYAAAGLGAALSPVLRARLLYYPAFLAELFAEGVISLKDRAEFFRHLPGTLNVLLSNFRQLAPSLEARLCGEPGSLEQIFWFVSLTGQTGQLKAAGYKHLLTEDPNCAYRLAADCARPDLLMALRAKTERSRGKSAAWAHFYISTHPMEHSLPHDLLHALRSSEEFSYLSARVLAGRRAHPALIAPLVANIVSARWAFHALRDGLASGSEAARLAAALHLAPEWGCEYYSRPGVTLTEMSLAYQAMTASSAEHPLVQELHAWYRDSANRFLLAQSAASTPSLRPGQ